jgi:hypothetical protein
MIARFQRSGEDISPWSNSDGRSSYSW